MAPKNSKASKDPKDPSETGNTGVGSVPRRNDEDTVTMTKADLQALLKSTMQDAMKMFKDNQADPSPILKNKVKVHDVTLAMYKGKYVVAFKNIQTNPRGLPMYYTDEFNASRRRQEEYMTIIYHDGDEDKVNMVDFYSEAMAITCRILKKHEQEEIKQKVGLTNPAYTGRFGEVEEMIFEESIIHRSYTVKTPSDVESGVESMELTVDEAFVNLIK